MPRKCFAVLTLAVVVASCHSELRAQQADVTVNGHHVPSKVVAGQVFVTPEDFAREQIGATLNYSASGIAITTSPETAAPTLSSGVGTIKGTVSYYFNTNQGNKPDTGSKVYAVPGNCAVADDELVVAGTGYLQVFGGSAGTHKCDLTKKTVADGNGNFELAALPQGKYTILIESNHTTDRHSHQKRVSKQVAVKGGDSVDVSQDFGVSYY